MAHLKLKSEKPEKTRSGLYLDRELYDQVKRTAAHNGMSYNETLILLIKRGIEASK